MEDKSGCLGLNWDGSYPVSQCDLDAELWKEIWWRRFSEADESSTGFPKFDMQNSHKSKSFFRLNDSSKQRNIYP